MYCSVGIVFLYLQNMLLDTLQCLLWVYTYSKCCQMYMQCLYCGSISTVFVVRCIAVSLLWVYTYSKYCYMHCNVFIVGLYLQYILLDALQCLLLVYTYSKHCRCITVSLLQVYTCSICCQIRCSVYCGSISLQ